MEEIWKDIIGYEGIYQISSLGRIKSFQQRNQFGNKKARILSGWKTKSHYPKIILIKDGKKERKYIHRLIAEAFIPNPNHYKFINHIDGNKQNYSIENLEWCTQKYNMLHAQFTLKKQFASAIRPIVRDDNKFYFSITEASKDLGCNISCICDQIAGRKKRIKGHTFKYADLNNEKIQHYLLDLAIQKF